MANQIHKKFIGDDQVDGDKLLLEQGQSVRAKDSVGVEQDLIKLGASDEVLVKGEEVALKSDITSLDGRLDIIEGADTVEGSVAKAEKDAKDYSDLTFIPLAQRAQPNGVASLGVDGKIPFSQIPSIAITEVSVVADIAARDALTPDEGDVAKVIDAGMGLSKTYIYGGASWIELTANSDVDSVNGQTGTVVLDAYHISVVPNINGLSSIDVQAALIELQDEINSVSGGSGTAISDLQEVVGVLSGETDLGTFSGSTIADNSSVKSALQDLETSVESKVAKAGDTMTGDLTIADGFSLRVDSSDPLSPFIQTSVVSSIEMNVQYSDDNIEKSATLAPSTLQMDRYDLSGSSTDTTLFINLEDAQPLITSSLIANDGSYQQDLSITQGGVSVINTDNNTSMVRTSNYDAGSAVLMIEDAITGNHDQVTINEAGISVSHFDGVDTLPILPTLDIQLTPKKYVDDAVAAQSTALSNHLTDSDDAHDASAISFVPAGNIVATTVQAAIQELDSEKANTTLSNLGTTAINADLDFNKGIGVTATIRGKAYVAGQASGQLIIQAGTVSGNVNSGALSLSSGAVINIAGDIGTSGDSTLKSGNTVNGKSGNLILRSGSGTETAASGTASMISGATNSGRSGDASLGSGNSTSGNSGDTYIFAGTSSATRGKIELDARQVELLNSKIVFTGSAKKIENLENGSAPSDAVNKSQLDAGLDLKLDLIGGTMSGSINMNNNVITHVLMNNDIDCAATKGYVDSVAEGLHVHAPARLLANVDLGGIYNNGVSGVGAHIDFSSPISSIDGVTSFSVGNRIIVANQNGNSLDLENGVYFIEDAADIDVNGDITKLTRSVDFNTPTEMAGGDFIFVQEGSQYADTGWVMTETVIDVGTTPVKFLQFSGSGSYTAGDGLNLNGTIFSVDVTDLVGFGIGYDGSNNFRIASEASGDGITGGDGVALSVDHDGLGLTFNAGQLSITVDGTSIEKITGSVLQVKDLGVTTAKLDDNSVTAAKLGSDVFADGLQQEVSGALGVKLDGTSLAVSSSGLKVNLAFNKQKFVYPADFSIGASTTVTLAHSPESKAVSAYVDRLAIHEGATEDFQVSGSTITFLNDLVSPGSQTLSSGDTIFVKYYYKV